MSNCLFCRIASGEIPSRVIYEDDHVFAFHDISPQAPAHAVVIPKRHIDTLSAAHDSDVETLGQVLHACARVAELLGLAKDGYRVTLNVGADGGQTVDHLHAHVLGGRRLTWPPG